MKIIEGHDVKIFTDNIEENVLEQIKLLLPLVNEEVLPLAATILSEYGWENDFALYYHPDGIHVRLYFRLAYVASCYLDGLWEEIAEQIPFVVPILKATIELRKIKNLGMLWIERSCKDLRWINLNNQNKKS